MAHAEQSIMIELPVHEVFEFILQGEHNALWRTAVMDVRHTSGDPTKVGARYSQTLKGPGGRSIDADYEIVELEQDKKIAFQVRSGPARPRGLYLFEAIGAQTKVTFILDYKPTGLMRLLDSLISKAMVQEVASLTQLKSHLEQEP